MFLLALATLHCIYVDKRQHTFIFNEANRASTTAFGGAWEFLGNTVHNRSDERGAKLTIGNSEWRDFTLVTDMKLDSTSGDMGVIVRTSSEEEGVDAYQGYYVGLRTADGNLVAGKADHGWMEIQPVAIEGGVRAGMWYRLQVTVVGCHLAASAENLLSQKTAWLAVEDDSCPRSGHIGLRSLASGGTWRNINIREATYSDYLESARHAPFIGSPIFPKSEAAYNRSFRFSPAGMPNALDTDGPELSLTPLVKTNDLQNMPFFRHERTRLRGVVTLASGKLYIQDIDGGVAVSGNRIPRLNAGDEVEVTGVGEPGLYSPRILDADVRLLGSGDPVLPIAITPTQAESGAYDAKLVETEGQLQGVRQLPSREQMLDLLHGGQHFIAIYRGDSSETFAYLQKNSTVRVRGICTLDRGDTHEYGPFAVVMRSVDDIVTVAPAPWWTPWHLFLLLLGLLCVALLIQQIYFRVKVSKANAIARERERLAHDIHDTLAQSFAGIGYQLQGIRRAMQRHDNPQLLPIETQIQTAYRLVETSHREASRTIAFLSASPSEPDHDIMAALVAMAKRIAGDLCVVKSETEGIPFRVSMRFADVFTHIGQEAITNSLTHGSPTWLRIVLRYHEPFMELVVEDNGCGFEYTPKAAGFGILGMRRRAQSIHGDLKITRRKEGGTQLQFSAELKRSKLWTEWNAGSLAPAARRLSSVFSRRGLASRQTPGPGE